MITIEANELILGWNYLIEDAAGRIVLEGKLDNNDDAKNDGSELSNGVYFIKIHRDNEEIVKKFIKQ